MITALKAIAKALASGIRPVDTHTSATKLKDSVQRPDCSFIHIAGRPCWATLVSLLEARVTDSARDIHTMWGQQTDRCQFLLASQPARTHLIAIGLTMNALELITAHRPEGYEHIQFGRIGPVPFSFHASSPGLKLLVRLMATPASQQGFCPCDPPPLNRMRTADDCWEVGSHAAIRPASPPDASFLFRVIATLQSSRVSQPAVLKLCRTSHEASAQLWACTMHANMPEEPVMSV
ncbi:hypothetical protein MMC07_005705 [Pseudocyphellaria aurata]|nr:hypothetical protein [Pseudocyphellaria aurata]